jgi:hypothetical protein
MKFVIATTILLLGLTTTAVFGAVQTCPAAELPCKNHTGAYFISRLWSLRPNATFTSADVINDFKTNFGPTVSSMPGFIEYVGSTVNGNSSLTFFFNVFADQTTGLAAQAAATNFFRTSDLAGQIMPVRFETGKYDFHIRAADDCNADSTGLFLSYRLYQMRPNATITPAGLTNSFLQGFAPTIRQQPGFKEYGAIELSDGLVFFYNIFSTAEEATTANQLAANFFNANLAGQAQRIGVFASTVQYDIQCTRPAAATA